MFAGLFALALVVIAIVAQVMILQNARQTVRQELVAASAVYDRLWQLRGQALGETADLLARDFGFRAAVATRDLPTVASALDNLRGRAGAGAAFVVMADGDVIGDGSEALRAAVADLPYALDEGRGSGIVGADGAVHQVVIAPILAPAEIGWIAFSVHLDAAELATLEGLSAIPISAAILHRPSGAEGWAGAALDTEDSAALDRLAAGASLPFASREAGGEAIALAAALPAFDGKAALLLRYPLAKALAGFRMLQWGILAAGLLGLLLVIAASNRLARSIARPIAALDQAARALKNGDRSRVAIESGDEIGRLAASFNAMSQGIFEREDRIAHLAFNDVLTGLPNRVFFREQLDTRLKSAVAREAPLTILCLDLDGFKAVNDTLGHPFGDKVLAAVGAVLEKATPDCFLARLGGDEFAIILPTGQGADEARSLSRRIADAMEAPLLIDGQQALVGTSIGIAIAPGDGDSADILLKNADLALYRAKQDGRGVLRFFQTSLDEEAQARRQMEIDLRTALAEGQFALHFQPIFAAEGQRILCFESLLRWHHPVHGLVSPARFIPVAEETGLILRIGEWVLHEACRQASRWDSSIRIAVNVSARQFRNPGLNAAILQALANSGIDPGRLEVEITESIFLDSASDTLDMLHALRRMGVRIALDDFGTGYSSLSYLRSFPFDKVKIDKSFVDNISSEHAAEAIVHAIVTLAEALGMDTTAEGVETADQLDRLRAQGCGSIQGYLLSRPLDATAACALAGAQMGAVRAA